MGLCGSTNSYDDRPNGGDGSGGGPADSSTHGRIMSQRPGGGAGASVSGAGNAGGARGRGAAASAVAAASRAPRISLETRRQMRALIRGGNKPLKIHADYMDKYPTTVSEQYRKRVEFWETAPAYSGNTEIWSVLQGTVEYLLSDDIKTAQALVDSAGLQVPTGDLSDGCYDERGVRYVIPEYCLADQLNPLPEEEAVDELDMKNSMDEYTSEMAAAAATGEKHRESGGTGKRIRVRVRLSTTGKDIFLQVGADEPCWRLKTRIAALCQDPGMTARIKLIVLGKLLSDVKTLAEQGWSESSIVQAMVVGEDLF